MDGFQKLAGGEKSGESFTINFINIYPPVHALELKEFFRKIGYISETRRDIKMLSKGLLRGQHLLNLILDKSFQKSRCLNCNKQQLYKYYTRQVTEDLISQKDVKSS